jgi:hypothetical protein
MRAVWSFWSRPDESGFGVWATKFHHLLSWALSVETCRRYFERACLVTDTPGARLLVDRLGLPFDEVSTALDGLAGHDPAIWALGKLHAYRAQKEPFVHIDADVFLWDPPPAAWLQSAVCAAYPEVSPVGSSVYRCASFKALLRAVGGWVPEEIDAFVPYGGMLRAENCAVVGGLRADFLSYYAGRAIALLDHPANQAAWKRRHSLSDDMVIFEQHMLSACLDYHARRPGSPYAGIAVAYLFPDLDAALRDSPRLGFTHLIGGAKRHPETLARLEARVAADHPELHRRCRAVGALG